MVSSQVLSPTEILAPWHFIIGDNHVGTHPALRHEATLRGFGAGVEKHTLSRESYGDELKRRLQEEWRGERDRVLLLGGKWVGDNFADRVNTLLTLANQQQIPTIIIDGPERLIGVQGNFYRIHRPRNIGQELMRILPKK